MARLVTCGFEMRVAPPATPIPFVEGPGYTGDGGATIDTGTPGALHGLSTAAMKCNGSLQRAQWVWTGATSTDYYSRAYLYIDSQSLGATITLMEFQTGASSSLAKVRLNTDLTLSATDGSNTVLGSSSALSATTLYCIEQHLNINASAGANDTYEVRINQAAAFYTSSAVTIGTAAPGKLLIGQATLTGSLTTHWDDVALNDSTGAAQTSWAGAGTIVALLPASDSSRTGYTGGGGGTTSLFDAVNNVPPVGVASTGTNSSQIGSTGNNTTDNYQPNLATYSSAGITGSDTVTLVEARAVAGNSTTTARNAGVQMVSNPAITEVTQGLGTTAAGTFQTGWTAWATAVSYAPSVTLGTAPVAEFRKATATTDNVMCCLLAGMVEVAQGAAVTITAPAASATASMPTPSVSAPSTPSNLGVAYLALGDTATLHAGLMINPGGSYRTSNDPRRGYEAYKGPVSAISTSTLTLGFVEVSAPGGGPRRVECSTQAWGVVQNQAGAGQAALAFSITRPDGFGTPVTVWDSPSGGSPVAQLVTGSFGLIPGWIDPGSYLLTVANSHHQIEAVPGSVSQSSTASIPAGSICVGPEESVLVVDANPDRIELIIGNFYRLGDAV